VNYLKINIMKHSLRIAAAAILLAVSINIYAAKGDAKNKKAVVLRFTGFELKGFNNLNMFTKTGFLLKMNNVSTVDKAPQTTNVNSVMTVQRGNTTFVYPYKYKVSVPLFKTPTAPKL
jgi:hypothetical protein